MITLFSKIAVTVTLQIFYLESSWYGVQISKIFRKTPVNGFDPIILLKKTDSLRKQPRRKKGSKRIGYSDNVPNESFG